MIHFKKAQDEVDFKSIHRLAQEIWQEHYANILSQPQIQYMIDNFQSPQAIAKQVQEGYEYFEILKDNQLTGYFGIIQKDDSLDSQNTKSIFLSKLYIQKDYRAQGIAKAVMGYIKKLSKDLSIHRIWLSVNKYNTNSLEAYKKIGFVIYREDKVPIGGNYIMDDYYMKLDLD